jgi:signal transduction histidine kinase
LELTIRDNGVGFNIEESSQRAVAGASLGLINLTERANLVGGNLSIESIEGRGTVITAHFPTIVCESSNDRLDDN